MLLLFLPSCAAIGGGLEWWLLQVLLAQ